MPRGRKPKVDLLLAPKEETKKVKSPWDKGDGMVGGVNKEEFSQAVIEKNREVKEKAIAIIFQEVSYREKDEITCDWLKKELVKYEGAVFWKEIRDGYIQLYTKCSETDNEVISKLRQKKLELEKLTKELSDEV